VSIIGQDRSRRQTIGSAFKRTDKYSTAVGEDKLLRESNAATVSGDPKSAYNLDYRREDV
jgi:hypothetical protein